MASKTDIPALTGIRGAAALWVAAYHLLLPAGFVQGRAAAWLSRGYLAVDLFFVLSGFVMALNYGALFRPGAAPRAVCGFLIRRAARLYPLYGTILLVRFAYTGLRYGTFALPRPWIAAPLIHPWIDVPANILMVQSWGVSESSIGTAWSISTEWGAYFLFPALAMAMLWRGGRAALATGCVAVLLLAGVVWSNQVGYHAGLLDAWDGQTPGPFLRCLAGFIMGMGVYRLSRQPAVARIAAQAVSRWAVYLALGTALALGAGDLVLYPLFPALVLCLACAERGGVMGTRVLVWLGEISYALYLLHIFLLHPLDVTRLATRLVLPAGSADIAAVTLVFAVLLAASHLAYHRIEKPGRRAISRAGERLLAFGTSSGRETAHGATFRARFRRI